MKYLSICSGIEAATVAWHGLGWQAAGFAEIDPFARAVLAHHYPQVPLHGDFTTLKENDYDAIDLLVGGTPCQSFSIAGLRKGLDDDRGNLSLEFIRLAQKSRARWLVWENVPGVLSIDKGRAFGTFLGGLAECGYGFAYRILDAQYFGVPQRRRRVFVVGHLGDWRRAAAILFGPESLRGDITPRKEARESVASFAPSSLGGYSEGVGTLRANGGDCGGGTETLIARKWPADIASTLNAHYGNKMGLEDQHALGGAELFVPAFSFAQNQLGEVRVGKVANTINTNSNASGRNTPMVAIQYAEQRGREDRRNGMGIADVDDPMYTLETRQPHGVLTPSQVRRLTPRECERLQGFPDDYTLINYRGKPAPDGNRYKVLGNSMAVPVMRWLGERITLVSNNQTICGR
jgi:DNA (cytosine-5)-methyltransferase 1